MPTIFTTAQHCETAFYAAFNARDFDQMMAVWAVDTPVLCVHPGGPALQGRDIVMASWRQILAGAGTMQLSVGDHQVVEHANLAVRFVHERIRHGADLRSLVTVLATNVFVREGTGWKLCSHHASSAPSVPITADGGTMH